MTKADFQEAAATLFKVAGVKVSQVRRDAIAEALVTDGWTKEQLGWVLKQLCRRRFAASEELQLGHFYNPTGMTELDLLKMQKTLNADKAAFIARQRQFDAEVVRQAEGQYEKKVRETVLNIQKMVEGFPEDRLPLALAEYEVRRYLSEKYTELKKAEGLERFERWLEDDMRQLFRKKTA